jgi:hypothetical protein
MENSTRKPSFEDAIVDHETFGTLELPQKRPILHPWLGEQTITLIHGWRGIGKTWFGMGLLDAITRGIAFGPWKVTLPVPCLYLEGEMAAQDVRERFQELNPDNRRVYPLFVYSDAYANSLGLPRANLLNRNWRNKIRSVLLQRNVRVWAVDNLASLAAGIDENKKQDWDPINSWLLELRFSGISTVLFHHTNKTGDQRGTSAREDNIDASLQLRQPADYLPEDGARFVVSFKKSRVRTEDLPLVADTQFRLGADDNGDLLWTWGNVKKETRNEVLRMLDDGQSYETICETLGITKGRVSQIKRKAINDGHLTEKGKLTQCGFRTVNED